MLFLSDVSEAQFARKKPEKEEKSTLREKIIGRTNAGKAFRVGSLLAAGGLGAYAYSKRGALQNMIKDPIDFYSSKVEGKDTTVISRKRETIKNPEYNPEKPFKIKNKKSGTVKYITKEEADKIRKESNGYHPQIEDVDEYKEVYSPDYNPVRKTEKDPRSFIGTGRKVNWGRVGKTVGVAGTTLAVPTSLAYLAGSKKDKEDIKNRVDKTWGQGRKTANDVRTWINTLHRVSR